MSTCFICLKVVKKVRDDYICRKCYAPPTKEATKPKVNWENLPDDVLKMIRPFVWDFTLKAHYEKLNAIYKKAEKTKFDKKLDGHENLFKIIKETPKCFKVKEYVIFDLNGRVINPTTLFYLESSHDREVRERTQMIKKTDVKKIERLQRWIFVEKYFDLRCYLNQLQAKL